MDESSKEVVIFRSGVQVAITISCLAVGVSLGVAVSSEAGALAQVITAMVGGITAAATASFCMYQAELRQTEPSQDIDGDDRGY